jgi:hypothetical protein
MGEKIHTIFHCKSLLHDLHHPCMEFWWLTPFPSHQVKHRYDLQHQTHIKGTIHAYNISVQLLSMLRKWSNPCRYCTLQGVQVDTTPRNLSNQSKVCPQEVQIIHLYVYLIPFQSITLQETSRYFTPSVSEFWDCKSLKPTTVRDITIVKKKSYGTVGFGEPCSLLIMNTTQQSCLFLHSTSTSM